MTRVFPEPLKKVLLESIIDRSAGRDHSEWNQPEFQRNRGRSRRRVGQDFESCHVEESVG